MTVSPSATTAGKSEGGAPRASPRAGGPAGLRQRKPTGASASKTAARNVTTGNNNMWRFYTEDSPGLKV
jgi:protein transport protein SEC61 subunit beta